MSAEIDNKNFITAAMAALGPSLTPDFSKFTYGLWISSFKNPNHSENGYSVPEPIAQDLVSLKFPITGKRVLVKNEEGEAAKVRFFLTESLLGRDGFTYLRDFELTDRFVSGTSPKIIMPDMDYAGKVYRRYEVSGLTKSKSTNKDILTVSGEDWSETNISVNSNDTDELYTYTDSNYSGYKNEVTTRYKFLYNDSKNSIPQDFSVFEIPYKLEQESSLKYRISRASEPLGIYDHADLTTDGKAIIDYTKYKEEVSGVIDGQITYNFEPIGELSFDKGEFEKIRNKGSVLEREIDDLNLTGFRIENTEDENANPVFELTLLSTGNFDDIYKVDVSVERFKTKDKPAINGFVMTGYDIGNGTVSLNVGVGSGVYPRINENGQPFGYDNLQDLIDVEQIQESEKYAQEIKFSDGEDEEDESKLAQALEDNFKATQNAIKGIFESDDVDKREGMQERLDIDEKDLEALTEENNIVQYYKTALPNFPLPKKIITKDFYSNYLNSGESYVVTPLDHYGLVPTFVSCGDKYGVLAYYLIESEEGADEKKFRSVVNSTCAGLYIKETGFCKGDSAIYDNNQGYSAILNLNYQNGLITQIPENGIISKSNYTNESSYLKAVNYFYTKNYVSSFNVSPSLPEADYITLFNQALKQVNSEIGGAISDSNQDSFYNNGGRSPRIFVEREIYTTSYKNQEIFELNQSIVNEVYITSDADLSSEEKEKLYCVHAFEPMSKDSFSHNKPNYFYPIQDYSEEISYKNFISSDVTYSTAGEAGVLSFVDEALQEPKLFRVEYVTGDSFSYNNTSNFRVWSAGATPPSNIQIPNQDTKFHSYHLYGYNSSTGILTLLKTNVNDQESATSASFSNLVVLEFIKQGLTDSVFQTEEAGITRSSINVNIIDAAGVLLDASKVKFNIQTYDYNVKINSEANQWVLFNKSPINNNIYGKRDQNPLVPADFSEPRFFQDEVEETKDLLSNLFFFPNGPYTSKNYEGKPVSVSSLNGLTDGLYENHIYIKEENEAAVKYESNYVLEILDNGNIVKQKPPASNVSAVRFKDTRRLKITKIKYNFYTKDLVLIGDSGSPYSVNFNDGWEYDLQYKAKNASYGSSGSSGSSGGGASVDWTIMSKEGDFTNKVISSEYAIISPYYFSEEDLTTPNFLSMVAFKTNLPLFLDDNNYEFRILKRQKLSVFSDSANVIKKTNFSPIKVNWNKVNGCSYYNIYQKDRNSNLNFLRSVPSGDNTFSYVVPDVKQENVDLGVFNFGANGENYYDIVISGIKPAVTKNKTTLSEEYQFEIGNSDFSETKVTKLSSPASYTPVNVSSPTYSQVLNFNNPETRDSNFTISPDSGGYYFVANGATSVGFDNITAPFESYVLNKNANSCSVNGTAVVTNNIAIINGPSAPSTVALSANPSGTFDLSSPFSDGVLYLKNNVTISNAENVNKKLTIINDSNNSITGTFGSETATVAANKTKVFTFIDDGTTKSIENGIEYSNITVQDDEIYHPDIGFVNLNHTTGSFLAGSSISLPVFNLHTQPLRLNNLSLEPDSFNYVNWNGSSATKVEKKYFDDLKLFLKGGESQSDSIFMIKDDMEIIISNIDLANGSNKEYFFLKDESVVRSVNIKIINGSSTEEISKQNQDFKLTINKKGDVIKYSVLYPSSSPNLEIKDLKEQIVLFKGDKVNAVNLKTLEQGLSEGAFVYFVNKNSVPVNFYKDNPEEPIFTLAPDQIARAILKVKDDSKTVVLQVLNETLSHFSFKVDPAAHLASSINILNLNFCATEISLPTAAQLSDKQLFLICRNRFLPNKIDKESESVVDINSLISTTNNPTTSEINEIGDIGDNSISLRVFNNAGAKSIERTSFLQKSSPFENNIIDIEDGSATADEEKYFYIRNKDIDTFTIKDSYNRKFKYTGKIFLPILKDSITVSSFDDEDKNGSFDIENTNSINFDYNADGYLNGRLQIDKPAEPDAIVYSRESEKGSVTKVFPNALANGQFLINFAYDTVTVTVDSSQVTLKKNRVVCNFGGNSVFPIYNKKEFFIALNNSDRLNTKIGGGTVFYYIINANEVDIDTIILPDVSAVASFVIKNMSGRSYQIKTLSGTLVHTLLSSSSNNQKLFTYTGATYTVTTDSTDYDDNPPPEPPQLPNFGTLGDKTYAPTSIKSANQYTELDNDHPLLDLFKGDRIVNDTKIIFKNKDFDLDFDGSQTKYRIFDIPASATTVTSSNSALIYCYGRKPLEIEETDKYIVNDFYLFVEHQGVAVDYEQLYIPAGFSKILDQGSHNLKIIDTNHTDLTKFFENQNQISALPSVIFIPITKYSSKFYLPNLQAKVPSTAPGSFVELNTLLSGKKILFVNLIKSDASGANSIYNYSNNTTTDLLDVNSLALFTASGGDWTKQTSNLPQVKNVFATLKNIKGINATSTATVTSAKEFVYLPNFNRFNVDLNSFVDGSFRDFYVFNSCKYRLYIESEQTLLGSGALTKIIKNQASGKFTSISVDQNSASMFSRVEETIQLPEDLNAYINTKYPNLQVGTVIKYVNRRGGVVSTYLIQYDIKNKAEEITINNKDFGVLDLSDLIKNDEHENLFIYGSSQINSSNNSFDKYELKILNASLLGEKKFYIYNNTPDDLQIYFGTSTNATTANSKRLIEITKSAVTFLGVHEKGKYYISNKAKNINYLFKQALSVFVDGLFDYTNLNGDKESSARVLNVLVTNMIRNEKYAPYAYYDNDGSFFEIVFDNFSVVDIPFLTSTSLNPNIFKKLLKPTIKITSNGHYLLENDNNDITVAASYPVEIFLINNCADDISVDIISETDRFVLYRNTVLVLEPGPSSGITSRYLKKAKSRDEFYCIFNPKTVISTQREITLSEKIIRNDDLFPILDDNLIEQKSYVKLLSKDGSSSKIGLFLRDYFNGRDIPTDSPSDVVGYEVGIGHETIYKFLFFDPSESTYTLPGIQSGIEYEVVINQSFFDNINIADSERSFTRETEQPYVKYKGKKYFNGEIILGDNVSTYEIKYPNFVTLYKIVKEIDRTFDDPETKGEEGGVDSSVTLEEQVEADSQELFNAKIREEYERLANSIISWLPQNQSAFWLTSNYSDDSWTIESVNNNVNPFTITSGDKTITFKSYKIKKTGLKTPLFSYNYSLFSALNPIRKMTDNRNLTIALDGALKPEQINKIKLFLGQEQFLDNTIFPNKAIRLGGFYIDSFFNENTEILPEEINDSGLLVNIRISKVKNMPDVKFDDFSKSSVIKIINRKE